MTIKQFLKSKVFKCIIVLMCIALVSGALLAICNDLLSVSDEERVSRTIKKIYNEEVGYNEVDVEFETSFGRIDKVYELADGNILVMSTGFDGYQKGTVSVWLVGKYENGVYVGVGKVSIAGNEKQTLMSKITGAVLEKIDGKEDVVVSGATFSQNALNNAVNTAVAYFNSKE